MTMMEHKIEISYNAHTSANRNQVWSSKYLSTADSAFIKTTNYLLNTASSFVHSFSKDTEGVNRRRVSRGSNLTKGVGTAAVSPSLLLPRAVSWSAQTPATSASPQLMLWRLVHSSSKRWIWKEEFSFCSTQMWVWYQSLMMTTQNNFPLIPFCFPLSLSQNCYRYIHYK